MNTNTSIITTDKAKELVATIKAGVAKIHSSEDWQNWLNMCANFWRYSFHNQMLIALQYPAATRVAGFSTWKQFGRHVKKGEKGIRILAPIIVKGKEGEDKLLHAAALVGFKVVTVFDIAQTEGKELPELSHPLKGEAPKGAFEAVKLLVEGKGYTVSFDKLDDGVYGYVNNKKQIVLKEGEEPAQHFDTLCHEMAHALLGHVENKELSRDEKELEAETTAWIVCKNLGLVTNGSSFAYLAAWAPGPDRDSKLERAANRACEMARKILAELQDLVPVAVAA